jgi:hypothetical protein
MGSKRPHAALPSCGGALGRDRERGYAPDGDFDVSGWRDRRRRAPPAGPRELGEPSICRPGRGSPRGDRRRGRRSTSVRLRAVSPVTRSSRSARSANASAPITSNSSWAARSGPRASRCRPCRRSHSLYRSVLGWSGSTPEKWDSGARVSPETSRGPVCKKLRLLPARVPISMQWLKMPRISPLRRMRRPSHTARVVIGVYSAESTLSRSCLVFRDGGTTARARRASESHTRGRDQPGSVPAELA